MNHLRVMVHFIDVAIGPAKIRVAGKRLCQTFQMAAMPDVVMIKEGEKLAPRLRGRDIARSRLPAILDPQYANRKRRLEPFGKLRGPVR